MPAHPLGAALLAAAALAAIPAAAQAADAPIRSIAFDASGARTDLFQSKYVSNDGRTIAAEIDDQPVIRDVAAGRTTTMPFGGHWVGASDDLSALLVYTPDRLTSQDPNGDWDFYVYRPATGAATLVSRAATVNALSPGSDITNLVNPGMSGDGKTVTFEADHYTSPPVGTNWHFDGGDAWKFNVTTGSLTVTSATDPAQDATSSRQVVGRLLSTNGATRVDSTGIASGSKRWPIPASIGAGPVTAAVSPDGGSVALSTFGSIAVVNVATGVATTFTVPAAAYGNSWYLRAADNGGATIVLDTLANRGSATGTRWTLLRATKAGTTTQVGNDYVDSAGSPVYSANLAFVATGAYEAQLGSTPLPGTEPTTPSTASAIDYLQITDTYCSTSIFGVKSWYRGFVYLKSGPQKTDPRTPSKADVLVFDTATKKTIDSFSITPDGRADVHVARTGGWSVSAKVTFTNGTTVSGLQAIPVHSTPTCPFIL